MVNRLIIGDMQRNVDNHKVDILRFEQSELSFSPVVTFLTAFYGFIGLLELYKPDEKGARPWAMTDVATFDANICKSRIVWSPHHVIEPMLYNEWPRFVEFEFFPADRVESGFLQLGVLERYMYGLSQAMITNFVEDQKENLRSKYGRLSDWPPVWKFAWMVRNAMSHGGRIRIDGDIVIGWKDISYSKADNGKSILNTDIWPGDLFFLMKEMEKELMEI